MSDQTTLGAGSLSSSASRVFRYEVVGLRQTSETNNNKFPIRYSGSVFIDVPYERMNQEMRRISRLGGKIVNVEELTFIITTRHYAVQPPHRGGGRR